MVESYRVEFISAGPGDPDLLTVAGARRLARCRAVLAPAQFQSSFAPLLRGKVLESPFPLCHAEVVEWVERHLTNAPVAFLIPGDFSVFNPFQSFAAHFGTRCRITPGVGSQAAAAAVLGRAFDLPHVAHTTVLASPRAFTRPDAPLRLGDYARPGNTLILFMNDRPLDELVAELRRGFGRDTPIAILERLACPDQRVTRGTLDTIVEVVGDRDPYDIAQEGAEPRLALTVVSDALEGEEPPEWWDQRVKKLWRPRGMR
ncbi:MAG TPA: SAM-dependent methyltransferase [Deferrisomatales bacterium]|nr:SAM-dependent methyltransferase [Deferrisomatales bacterium]